jgi:hypothetical protein
VGRVWVEQVFDRATSPQSGRRYRLLLLHGHGFHITPDFIQYCDTHRILLVILPPNTTHATYALQPLDVGCFKPLSAAYAKELTDFTHQSMGLPAVKKGDFFPLFREAWSKAFSVDIIQSSFKACGLSPWDPEVILSRIRRQARTAENCDNHVETAKQQWPKLHIALRQITRHLDDSGVVDTNSRLISLARVSTTSPLKIRSYDMSWKV